MSTIQKLISANNKAKSIKKEYFIHSNTLLLVNDPLSNNVDVESLKKKLEITVPKKLFRELDWIYIGEFPELETREVQSAYLRGAIYITNKNQTNDSLYAGIIHELAHSVENVFKEIIYGDDEVAAEFIGKRKKLRDILKAQGYELEDPSIFIRQEYNPDFDKFLYKKVGYDLLNQLCVGVFASPYAATSLREYFANGFEHYFLYDLDYLRKISPKLFLKISKLTKKLA